MSDTYRRLGLLSALVIQQVVSSGRAWVCTVVVIGCWSGLSIAAPPTALGTANAGAGGTALRETKLKTDPAREPLGIETPHPRFRWLLEADQRGELQSAYQIQISTSLEKLQAGIVDKWDSGKVRSDNSVEVGYGGRHLVSGERVYWKVRVWDQNGRPSPYSASPFF